jgi:GTPase SAR1 and related small G proteins
MFDSQSSHAKTIKASDLLTKILLLGDHGVGKTTLINKFSGQESISSSPTIGMI